MLYTKTSESFESIIILLKSFLLDSKICGIIRQSASSIGEINCGRSCFVPLVVFVVVFHAFLPRDNDNPRRVN